MAGNWKASQSQKGEMISLNSKKAGSRAGSVNNNSREDQQSEVNLQLDKRQEEVPER